MESTEFLDVDVRDAIATLTLNRPETLNALNPPLMRQLVISLRAVAEEENVRCVVLTGAGKGFCSGGDVQAMKQANDQREKTREDGAARDAKGNAVTTEQRANWLRRNAEASRLLHEMPKPTIAMINGACAGAGLSLAAACDFRYAAASAVFRPSFLAQGVSGDYGGSWLWSRILGTAKARELYLFDEKRSAQQAHAYGMLHDVFPDEALRDETMRRASILAAIPGKGAAFAKANLNAAMDEDFATHLDRESMGMMLSRNVLIEQRRRARATAEYASEAEIAAAMAVKEA